MNTARQLAPALPARTRETTRLESALRSGSGYVVVTCADRAAALAITGAVLASVDALAVLHVSTADPERQLRGLTPVLLEHARRVNRPVFVVTEVSEGATAESLEHIRMTAECAPDSIGWLRMVLVGDDSLEKILVEPEAAAISSRVCAHVSVVAPAASTGGGQAKLGWRSVSSALVLALAVVTLSARAYRNPAENAPSQAQADRRVAAPLITAAVSESQAVTAAEIASVPYGPQSQPVQTIDGPVAEDAASMGDAASAEIASTGEYVDRENHRDSIDAVAAPSAATHSDPTTGSTAGPAAEPIVDATAEPAVEPTAEKAVTIAAKPAPTAAIPAATPAPSATEATAVREVMARFSTSKPASREPAGSPPASTNAGTTARAPGRSSHRAPRAGSVAQPSSGSVVLQAGAFKDARLARGLQQELAADLEHVLVARLDPPGGPVYSVRVVGLDTLGAVATAESAIRRAGQDPRVISTSKPAPRPAPKRGSIWSRILGR